MASAVQQNTLSDVQQWRDRRHSGSLLHVVTDNTIKGKASTGGVRECLRLGFDPNAQRKDGCTPLHIACFRNGGEDAITLALRNDIARVLLKSHARTDIVNRFVVPTCAHSCHSLYDFLCSDLSLDVHEGFTYNASICQGAVLV